MSDTTLRMIGARADHHLRSDHNWNLKYNLTKVVNKSMAVDTRRRSEFVSEEIGAFLETPKGTPEYLQGKYLILKWWS